MSNSLEKKMSFNSEQLYSINRIALLEGKKKDACGFLVKNAAGLEMFINEDRALDIFSLSYKGCNIAYQGRDGLIAAKYANPQVKGLYNYYYHGGFLYTCGLLNVGPEDEIDGRYFPPHGSIATIPASNVSYDIDNEKIMIKGIIKETGLFKENLELTRRIIVLIRNSCFEIEDTITNRGSKDEFIYYLYHFNFGYPFLSKSIEISPKHDIIKPRNEHSNGYLSRALTFIDPVDGFEEAVFFLESKAKTREISIFNRELKFFVKIEYDTRYLPYLAEWWCPKSYDYALGIEPTNNRLRGRKTEIIENPRILKAQESITIKIKITVGEQNAF